jgi:type II secretion system protein N
VKKLLITLIAIPVSLWGLWMAFPRTSIQSIIEGFVSKEKLRLEVSGLKKGLFYNFTIDHLTLKSSGEEQLSSDNIYGRINPLSLMMLRLDVSFHGSVGGGNLSGLIDLKKNKLRIGLDVSNAGISDIPFLKRVGIKGTGTLSGKFTALNDTWHVEFVAKDSRFEPAFFSGMKVPLNFFHSIRGSMDIKGNIIYVVSVALEGRDIYARLKGVIKDAVLDLTMELMPGISFLENPLFIYQTEKYKVSPGYYVIPVKGNL